MFFFPTLFCFFFFYSPCWEMLITMKRCSWLLLPVWNELLTDQWELCCCVNAASVANVEVYTLSVLLGYACSAMIRYHLIQHIYSSYLILPRHRELVQRAYMLPHTFVAPTDYTGVHYRTEVLSSEAQPSVGSHFTDWHENLLWCHTLHACVIVFCSEVLGMVSK